MMIDLDILDNYTEIVSDHWIHTNVNVHSAYQNVAHVHRLRNETTRERATIIDIASEYPWSRASTRCRAENVYMAWTDVLHRRNPHRERKPFRWIEDIDRLRGVNLPFVCKKYVVFISDVIDTNYLRSLYCRYLTRNENQEG